MSKQLRIDLNRFPKDSPERATFEQIQQYLLSLDASTSVKNNLKTEIFEGIAAPGLSPEPYPKLIVNGKIYSAHGFTEVPPLGPYQYKRWVPISVENSGNVYYGITFDFSLKDNEISLQNPSSVSLAYRVIVQYI